MAPGDIVMLTAAVRDLHRCYPRRFLTRCHDALRPGGKLLMIEPKGHVDDEEFEASGNLALEVGFSEVERHGLSRSRSLVLEKSVD